MAFNKEMNGRINRDAPRCKKIINLATGEEFINHTQPNDWYVGENGLCARVAREWKILYEFAVKNPEQLERVFPSRADFSTGDNGGDDPSFKYTVSNSDLQSMSYPDLRDMARDLGLQTAGKTKSALIPLVMEASANRQALEKV
jgi:hypothetical protein